MPSTQAAYRPRSLSDITEAVADEIEALSDIHARLVALQGNADSYFMTARNPQAMRVLNSLDKFSGSVSYAKRSGGILLQILSDAQAAGS